MGTQVDRLRVGFLTATKRRPGLPFSRMPPAPLSPPPCLVSRLTPVGGMAACCRCTQVRARDGGVRNGILFSLIIRYVALLCLPCSALPACVLARTLAGLEEILIFILVSMIL